MKSSPIDVALTIALLVFLHGCAAHADSSLPSQHAQGARATAAPAPEPAAPRPDGYAFPPPEGTAAPAPPPPPPSPSTQSTYRYLPSDGTSPSAASANTPPPTTTQRAQLAKGLELRVRCILTRRKGDAATALEACKQSLELVRSALGEGGAETAISYGLVGDNLADLEQYEGALVNHQHALAIRNSVLHDHTDTADSYAAVGEMLSVLEDDEQALAMYSEALRIRRKLLGDDHPDTAAAYHAIGDLQFAAGRNDAALSAYEAALRGEQLAQPPDLGAIAETKQSLGMIHLARVDLPDALAMLEDSLALRRKAYGEQGVDTGMGYFSLAMYYDVAGDKRRSLELHRRALALFEDAGDEGRDDAERVRGQIADLCAKGYRQACR